MSETVSANVAILTLSELKAREDAAFQRGVERGTFEAALLATARSGAFLIKANAAFEGKDQGSAIIYRAQADALSELFAPPPNPSPR